MTEPRANDEEIRFRDAAPTLELMCWTVLALAPFLYWVNGPAVSTDQFVTQVTLLCVSLCGAIGLRMYNWRQRRPKTSAPSID